MADPRQPVFDVIRALLDDPAQVVDASTPLIGDGRVLDSMKLVELCLALEDLAADQDFEFDWTSESAMSRSRSMFRTAGALAEAFLAQQALTPQGNAGPPQVSLTPAGGGPGAARPWGQA